MCKKSTGWLKKEGIMDFYNFYTGHEFEAYEFLGAHYSKEATVFRVFAPSARGVGLLISGVEYPMTKIYNGHFYEITLPDIKEGTCYEYRVYSGSGYTDHADPYGFGMELRPAHCSVVRDINSYRFHDQNYMKSRRDTKERPVNIYEMHLGSFRKPSDKADDWYSYGEIADLLIPYLLESGYNYVEFMPLCEYPCDESWGYQNTGFFAPTARYGTAGELQELIDKLHQNNIGVLLDFVCVHFAVDSYGLMRFDGSQLYEYPNSDVGVSEWGSCNFMHSRGEVRSFLQSAANYWLKEYHFDGLRVDAISRIIYWQGDERRGENKNAIDFIRVMNRGLKERHAGCILAAEDSTNYPNVTRSLGEGGLGFDYKWNMGWMNDTLEYFRTAPEYRTRDYHKLTFSMMYAYNEDYLLPFSHDEVVHGKATITQKMSGYYEDKFPQARALYLYMMLHPGKKLNFMGNEIGQLREWDEKREQDWELRKYPMHDSFYHFIVELNQYYLTMPTFYSGDYVREGFLWLDCHRESDCIYAIQRNACGKDGERDKEAGKAAEAICGIFNFSKEAKQYPAPFIDDAKYRVLLNTDWERFSGGTKEEAESYSKGEIILLPPYSGILFCRLGDEVTEKEQQ